MAVAALGHQPVQCANQTQADVPLEAFLQFEEFAKGRVLGELAKIFALLRHARISLLVHPVLVPAAVALVAA